MKTEPTLNLNLQCPEGRAIVRADVTSLSTEEREFLMNVMAKGETGSNVEFGVDQLDDGRFRINFTVGKPSAVN